MIEILAPAGDMEKLKTAIYYGADAVYFAGKQFGLRALATNFSNEEIKTAVELCHANGLKAYVTLNIYARNEDFTELKKYLKHLEKCKVDAVIVSDLGVLSFVTKYTKIPVHVSTQANVVNKYSAMQFVKLGATRIVLARELSIEEVKEIATYLKGKCEIECFVHGAMCISYSGRCLLSNYLTGRDSNRGACVQACRWEYCLKEKGKDSDGVEVVEDEKGTYFLNSKDMCLISHIKELVDAGITSFKIEGRMKSPYYVATVVNAYKRALELAKKGKKATKELVNEVEKTSHRRFTTGFMFHDKEKEYTKSSATVQSHEFSAVVLEAEKGRVLVEMRNRFKLGDKLEVLSPSNVFNKKFVVKKMVDAQTGEEITDAKTVQQKLWIYTKLDLHAGDILRKEKVKKD